MFVQSILLAGEWTRISAIKQLYPLHRGNHTFSHQYNYYIIRTWLFEFLTLWYPYFSEAGTWQRFFIKVFFFKFSSGNTDLNLRKAVVPSDIFSNFIQIVFFFPMLHGTCNIRISFSICPLIASYLLRILSPHRSTSYFWTKPYCTLASWAIKF